MAISDVTRARVILDLLKDGNVTTEANYNGSAIDKASAVVASRYADAFLKAYPFVVFDAQNPPQPRSPTNEELATNFLKVLRQFVKGIHVDQRIKTDQPAQITASRTAAEAETLSDLGE